MIEDLDKDELFKLITKISDACYAVGLEVPDEDKYPIQYTLKNTSFDMANCVAEAFGSTDPRDRYWKLGIVRRSIFSARNTLQQTHKRGYIKLDPELMIMISKAVTLINQQLKSTKTEISAYANFMDLETYQLAKKKVAS